MTVDDALKLNGCWVTLMLDFAGESSVFEGRIVGVLVPAAGVPIAPQLLLADESSDVTPSGAGLEVFIDSVVAVVFWSYDQPEKRAPALLRLVAKPT